ncbi:MAG: PfkB family carbohydrate kinase [Fimbriimonadaceae bacterium]
MNAVSRPRGSRPGVACAGNFILDRVKFIDVYPEQDALANIGAESQSNGGAAYNVLLDLANLGAPFPLEAIGCVGEDAAGRFVAEDCARHGVDASQLHAVAGMPTSYTDVMTVRSTGRRTFFHQRGANARFGPEHFDFGALRSGHLHLGYILLLDRLDELDPEYGTVAARVLAEAREAGLTTSVDVVSEDSDRFRSRVLPALAHVDVAFMNEFEASRTSGIPIVRDGEVDEGGLQSAATTILSEGKMDLLVIHTPKCGYAWTRDGSSFRQGSVKMPAERVVSAVGAGDAFAAGFLLAWRSGQSVPEALRLAVCAAASCVTAAGTSEGVRPAAECLSLADEFGPW